MKRIYVILLNVGYWFLYILLISILYFASQITVINGPSILDFSILVGKYVLIPSFISFYGSYFFLFRLFIQKTSQIKLIFSTFFVLLLSSFIALMSVSLKIEMPIIFLEVGIISFLLNTFNALLGFILHSFTSWFTDLREKEALSQKTKNLQLEMLKLKLDPHFLFNTINNIDVLIETDSTKASEYILKLSSLLRFYLYKASNSVVQLSDELKYIGEYVDLQRIRTTNENFVQLSIEGNPNGKKIAPMLLISFVENAFKHSQNKKVDTIYIHITIYDEQIHFQCKNKLGISSDETGIGNELVKNRLELIYGDNYDFDVNITGQDYQIDLRIPV